MDAVRSVSPRASRTGPRFPEIKGLEAVPEATLLHAAGAPRDRFNLAGSLKDLDRAGPLPELLR